MIPIRVNHGSIKNKIKWDSEIELINVDFDPLLLHLFTGLKEDKFPFNFISIEGIKDLFNQKVI